MLQAGFLFCGLGLRINSVHAQSLQGHGNEEQILKSLV
jgi:hypothetical protein